MDLPAVIGKELIVHENEAGVTHVVIPLRMPVNKCTVVDEQRNVVFSQ